MRAHLRQRLHNHFDNSRFAVLFMASAFLSMPSRLRNGLQPDRLGLRFTNCADTGGSLLLLITPGLRLPLTRNQLRLRAALGGVLLRVRLFADFRVQLALLQRISRSASSASFSRRAMFASAAVISMVFR